MNIILSWLILRYFTNIIKWFPQFRLLKLWLCRLFGILHTLGLFRCKDHNTVLNYEDDRPDEEREGDLQQRRRSKYSWCWLGQPPVIVSRASVMWWFDLSWAEVSLGSPLQSTCREARAGEGGGVMRYKWHRSQAFHISFSSTLQSVVSASSTSVSSWSS